MIINHWVQGYTIFRQTHWVQHRNGFNHPAIGFAQRRNPLVVALALLLFERRKLLRRDRKLIIGRWGGGQIPRGRAVMISALLWWLTVRTRIWVCLKIGYVPLNLMVLLIIIPFWNGYFIGNMPYFQTNPYSYLLGMNNSTIWIKYVATSCRDIIGMMIWIGVLIFKWPKFFRLVNDSIWVVI